MKIVKFFDENMIAVEKYIQQTFDICNEVSLYVNAGINILALCRHQRAGRI